MIVNSANEDRLWPSYRFFSWELKRCMVTHNPTIYQMWNFGWFPRILYMKRILMSKVNENVVFFTTPTRHKYSENVYTEKSDILWYWSNAFYLFISILNIIYKDSYSSVKHKLKPYIALYISFSADFTVF